MSYKRDSLNLFVVKLFELFVLFMDARFLKIVLTNKNVKKNLRINLVLLLVLSLRQGDKLSKFKTFGAIEIQCPEKEKKKFTKYSKIAKDYPQLLKMNFSGFDFLKCC